MTTQWNELHVADDVLVQILDDEMPAHQRAQAHSHLETCPVCTQRLSTIERRTLALSALLQIADPDMPLMQPPARSSTGLQQPLQASRRRHAVPAWLKAAAVVLLIAGAAVMASPVRARVLDWIRDALLPPASAPASAPAAAPADLASAGHAVEFLLAGHELNLEVVDAEVAGELRIGVNDGRAVVARALNATSAVELLVLPAGLRIINTAARATYDISVPAQVTHIRVQIGREAPFELESAQLPRVILLGAQRDGPGT